MRNKMLLINLLLTISLLVGTIASGQQIEVNSSDIEPLIREWNYAHDAHSVTSFYNVYGASTLLFYTERVTRSQAIALKEKLLRDKPEFRQRIVSSIKYTPYTGGVVKCEFDKEAFETSRWKRYPSYLLVSYEDNRYWIVGESDELTDKKLGFKLDIGEPILLEPEQPDSVAVVNVAAARDSTAHIYSPSTKHSDFFSADHFKSLNAFIAYVTAPELVTVRRDHIFLLIGLLLFGIVGAFIVSSRTDKLKKRKARKASSVERERLRLAQQRSAFEEFVRTLFDPLYFRSQPMTRQKMLAGHLEPEVDATNKLQVEFKRKETHANFFVQCQYSEDLQDEVVFSQNDTLSWKGNPEARGDRELYYILGFGGKPDDPYELYLVPSSVITAKIVSRAALHPFKKSGMFFYNETLQRLQ